AFAWGRAAPSQLEMNEIKVPYDESDEQHDGEPYQGGILASQGEKDQRQVDKDRQHEPNEHVDGEGDQPLAVISELDRNWHAFRGDDGALVAAAAFQELGGALMGERHRRSSLRSGNRQTKRLRWPRRWRSVPACWRRAGGNRPRGRLPRTA